MTLKLCRRVPLKCTCVRKQIEIKRYLSLYHAQFHLDQSRAAITFFTSKGHIPSSRLVRELYDQGVTEFNVCSIRSSKFGEKQHQRLETGRAKRDRTALVPAPYSDNFHPESVEQKSGTKTRCALQ